MPLGHDDYTTCTPEAWVPDHEVRFSSDLFSGFGEDLGLEDADVGEVAVGAGEVEPVSYHELVGHLEAEVVHVELHPSPGGLGEERADLQGGGLARKQGAPQVGEG